MDRVSSPPVWSRAAAGVALLAGLVLLPPGCAGPRPSRVSAGLPALLPEHYTRSIAALGYPGAHRSFRVGGGSLVSSGDACLEWALAPRESAIITSPVWFERDGVPVAHWWIADATRRVSFEAAAIPDPALGDSSLLLAVRATAEWLAPGSGSVELVVTVRGVPEGPDAPPPDAPDTLGFDAGWEGDRALRDGAVVAALDPAAAHEPATGADRPRVHVSRVSAVALRAHCQAHLRSGQRHSWAFWMPLYPLAPGQANAIARRARPERVIAEARERWRAELAHGARFESPDTLVTLAWRVAMVTLLTGQIRVDERWMPIGNPFQYRDCWIRDGVRVARALAVAGRTELALDDVRSLARYQWPNGVFLSQRGQLDGTGQMLWAFDQIASLSDTAVAREFLPAAAAGFRWLADQRRATRALGLPWPGMLPAVEPRDMEMTRGRFTGNDAWALAGCRATVRLGRRAGAESLGVAATREWADARAAFAAALARRGSDEIPPAWDVEARDWGNASTGYPTFAVPAADPRLAKLARRMRVGAEGLVVCDAAGRRHTYLGADLAESSLLADRPVETRAWLDGLLAHSSATLGQAEAFLPSGDFGTNFPPHGTAAAMLIDLLRNRIVCDVGDTLELGLGLALADWNGTRLTGAPTRFGVADVALARPAPASLRLSVTPLGVPIRVRVPDEAGAITVASPGARFVAPHWVDAPAGTREIVLHLAERRP